MSRRGFSFGSSVRFLSHDQGYVDGIVLGESFPSDFDERQYSVIYRGSDGTPIHDPWVAESFMKPAQGWVSPENQEGLQRLVESLVARGVPQVEQPDE